MLHRNAINVEYQRIAASELVHLGSIQTWRYYKQVLELMQMHPKERLGQGYFDSQLV